MLLRGGHGSPGGVHLRLGREVLGLDVVNLLLRDEAGMTLGCFQQALVLGVKRGVGGLGPIDLVLRLGNLFLALR